MRRRHRRAVRDCCGSTIMLFLCGFVAGLFSFALFLANQSSTMFLPLHWTASTLVKCSCPSKTNLISPHSTASHRAFDGSIRIHNDQEVADFEDNNNNVNNNKSEPDQEAEGPLLIAFQHQHDLEQHNASLAAWLSKRVRVLCWIATNGANTPTKAVHVNATWAPRCNKHVFVSAAPKSGLPSLELGMKNESRKVLWGKTKRAFKHFYETELDNFDWFLKADDDTYVIVENLRLMLASHSPDQPVYLGCKFKPFVKQGYMSGGSGYVLSREALRRFVEVGLANGTCKKSDFGAEDAEMGICLEKLGVKAGDSRDENGRHRMLPFSPLSHFEAGRQLPGWFQRYMFYPYKQGGECCSDWMVSFHYVTRPLMYAIHNLVYHIRPFGLDQSFTLADFSNNSLLNAHFARQRR